MTRSVRQVAHFALLLCVALGAVMACGEPPPSSIDDNDENPYANHQFAPDFCQAWCEVKAGCDVIKPERLDDCVENCPELVSEVYLEDCLPCLQVERCEDQEELCRADGQVCHRPATVSYLVNIGGLSDYEGAMGYGQLVRYDGMPLGAFAEGDVTEGGLGLEFGTVLTPATSYRLQFYVDVDGDQACDAEVDLPYEAEVHVMEPSVVVYGIESVPEEEDPLICEEFTSTAELCRQRCEHFDACGHPEGGASVDACRLDCEAELSAAFVHRCVGCLEEFSCADQELACLQTGGVCNEDYVAPSAEFLFAGSGFADYEGLEVMAVLQDLAGNDVTDRLYRTIDDGGFFMHFGFSIWPGQTYRFVFFIDDDESGGCTGSNPGWALELEIGDVILHYELHEHTPEEMEPVCEWLE